MSPTERALWFRVQRRAATLEPELAARLIRAFRLLATQLSEEELAALIRSGTIERVFSGPLDARTIERAFIPVREQVRRGVLRSAEATVREMPTVARTGALEVGFNMLHPNVVAGIAQLETRVMATLTEEVRETVRAVVDHGLQEGVHPRATARQIRGAIGLAPNQVDAVQNFRGLLEAGDRGALTRALRDHRFDATLTRALGRDGTGLTTAQIDTMTEAYERRMIAFHAETVARTVALDAQKLGQRLSWDQAVARGDIDGRRLRKRWVGVLDDRERPTHVAMEGESVPYDQPYSNGQQQPGDGEYNCRCISIFYLAQAA